jgi:hypothetical protein
MGQDNPKEAAQEAVQAATEAVTEATEQVEQAAESAGIVGAVAEVPQATAEQMRTLLDNVAALSATSQRLVEHVFPPTPVPVPSQATETTAVPETEVELPATQIIPKKPHWFHRLPRVPLITG